mgnify:FL=1
MRKEYKQMMDQLSPREELVEQVLAQAGAHAEQKQNRRRPMHKKKLILALAAALVVLTGSAMAVGSQLGLLNVFFQGDTSGLEPYVQTEVGSAENEDYRFTVNSAYYDGMTVYATVTVEGLNDQAVENLKSNKVIAEYHLENWGQEMVDGLMASGSTGPDTFQANQGEITEKAGYEYTGSAGGGGYELSAPSDASRSWSISLVFQRWLGPMDTPMELWVGFMGRECSVEIPLDTVVGSAHLEPDQEFLFNPLNGQRGILTEATLTPTQLYYEIQTIGERKRDMGWDAVDYRFILKMKDGSLITSEQLGTSGGTGSDRVNDLITFRVNFDEVKFTDVNEVASIIFGDTEFPLDGSEPTLAEENERLYPFFVPRYGEEGPFYTDVEALCQGLGAEYIWDADTQTATATYRDVTVEMTAGSSQVLVNGEPMELIGDLWDEMNQEIVEDVPLFIKLKDGALIAPTYLFSNGSTTGGVWDIGISMVHLADGMEQDPNRLVVLP